MVKKIEAALGSSDGKTRQIVNASYDQIVQSIFERLESLSVEIASDDKEQLNANVLLIGKSRLIKKTCIGYMLNCAVKK